MNKPEIFYKNEKNFKNFLNKENITFEEGDLISGRCGSPLVAKISEKMPILGEAAKNIFSEYFESYKLAYLGESFEHGDIVSSEGNYKFNLEEEEKKSGIYLKMSQEDLHNSLFQTGNGSDIEKYDLYVYLYDGE